MICTLWTPFQAERDWKKSYREILLILLYIFYSLWLYLVCVHRHMRKNKCVVLSIRKPYLRTNIFQLVGFIKQSCFGPCMHFTLYRSIPVFKKSLYQTTYLKRGGVNICCCTPISEESGLHVPFHPSLNMCLGKTYIMILFLSNLNHRNVPYSSINIAILFLIYMHIQLS